MKKVEKVTSFEIDKARENVQPLSTMSFVMPKKNSSKSVYISRLSMKNLEDFFRPFNINTIQKYPDEKNPEFIFVSCENFDATFNDYEMAFQITSPIDSSMKSSGDFDFYAFLTYCDEIDTYPDQAMENLIATELLGKRFESYATDREKFKNKVADSAFAKLPKATRRILRPVDDSLRNEITGIKNQSIYGTSNIEEIIRRDAE